MNEVSDDHVIVRGGQAPLPEPGVTFSGSHGVTLSEAASGVPHGIIRTTTAGAIRAGGGTVTLMPEAAYPGGPINDRHVDITLGPGSSLFSEPLPNPIPKADRVADRPKTE